MPPRQDNHPTNTEGNNQHPQMNEHFLAQVLQITTGKQYTPTNEQVDKMLALHEKAMDYTHKDNQSFLPKDIFRFCAFVLVLLVVVGIFIFSSFYAKEYLGQIVAAIFGFIAGGGSGYAYGTSNKRRKPDDD